MAAFAPRSIALLSALALSAASFAADAKTLRWAGRGDPQTMDPYSQNENLTNNINELIYDTLVMRDKDLKVIPGLATSWEQVNPTTWRFKLRPGVKFHDGSPFTPEDVVFSFERASAGHLADPRLRDRARASRASIDDATVEFVDQRPEPDRARAPRHDLHHEQVVVREEQVHEAARLQEQGGDDHRAAGQRHRRVRPEGARAGRAHGDDHEPGLVGLEGQEVRRQRHRDRLHADHQRRDAPLRADRRQCRLDQRPGAAGRPEARADAGREGHRGLRAARSCSSAWTSTATSCCTRTSRARTR